VKTHNAGITMLQFCKNCYSKASLESKNWKLCNDQKAKGRNAHYAHVGNTANKYRIDAVNIVGSSAFFIYIIALKLTGSVIRSLKKG